MGFFDSKKSTITTVANTSNKNLGAQTSGESTAYVIDGSGNQITDGGAIAAAFDFMGDADAANTKRLGDMLDFGGNLNQTAFDFSLASLRENNDQAKNLIADGFQAASSVSNAIMDAYKNEDSPNRDLLMVGVLAAAGVSALYLLNK